MKQKNKIVKKTLILYRAITNKVYSYCSSHITEPEGYVWLKSIENIKGKTDPKLIKISNEYSLDVFGSKRYAPYLYAYSAFNGVFKEGWIPFDYYYKVVVPIIKGQYSIIPSLKSVSHRLLNSEHIPDILYYVNGLFFTKNYEILHEKDIIAFLFSDSEKIVFKKDESSQGRNIYFFQRSNFNIEQIKCIGNGVFQKYVQQHDFFNKFSDSASTIRFTTVIKKDGTPSLRSCYLRLGLSGDTHIKSSSNIRIAVDVNSGQLSDIGYLADWQPSDKHPESLTEFKGEIIPYFKECVSIVLSNHKLVPQNPCIGWDLIIDKNNTINIIEYNGSSNDIKFCEAAQGPCFSDMEWDKLSL